MPTAFITARSLLAPYVDNGVATSDTARIDARINEAQRRLIDQYNFISRREESERSALVWQQGGTTGIPTNGDLILDNLDATKNMILSLWREENNSLDQAAALEKRAYEYIERNILNAVERERKTAFQALATASNQNTLGGLTGRIGLETAAQYRLTESRIKSYINQAYQQAVDHFNFISRREDNRQSAITFSVLANNSDIFNPLLPSEVVKLLTLGLLATDNGGDGSGLKKQGLDLIERNITTVVETARRDTAGDEGRLHNELPEGEKILTSRLTTYLSQAATEAGAHWDFLARREDYSSGTKPFNFSFEARKKLVESYLATTGGAAQVSTALKQEALSIIERDLMAQVEAARRAVSGEEGRLHNELPDGVKIPTSRLTTFLSQANTEIAAQQAFLQRREDYNGSVPSATYEQRKLLVESYLAASKAAPEAAATLKQTAFALIERDVVTAIEAARRQTRQTLLSSDPLSFGYHWGRIGLETQDGLKFSDSAVKRAVNSAEEQLMLSGKWLGTVEEYTLTVTETGEVYLPREIETLLFVSFDGSPKPIHDRFNEWLRGGTGYRTDDSWRNGLVDRGEGVDPVDGTIKHKYFFSLPTQDTPPVIRVLAKRRFVPHTNDSEALYLRNYQAVAEMAKGILSGGSGPEMDVRMKNAKEMLATQVNQQFFRGQPNIVRRRVLAMR